MNHRAGALATALLLGACARGGPIAPTAPAPSTTSTTTTTKTSTTAAAGPGSRGLAATDRLQTAHHLAAVLPWATAHYRIDFSVTSDGRLALRVTLLAVLNDAADLATYQGDLRRYRAEALAFIEAQGDDPATYTVRFLPDPTTP